MPSVSSAILTCRNKKKKLKKASPGRWDFLFSQSSFLDCSQPQQLVSQTSLSRSAQNLAVPTQPFICTHHTQGHFNGTLRIRALPILRFGQDASLFLRRQWTCSFFLLVELLATYKKQSICCGPNFPLNLICSYCTHQRSQCVGNILPACE